MNYKKYLKTNFEEKNRMVIPGRFMFTYLLQPDIKKDGKKQWRVTLVIPKEEEEVIDAINEKIQDTFDYGVEKGKFGDTPPKIKKYRKGWPLRDGDDQEGAEIEGYFGCYYITPNNDRAPQIVNVDGFDIDDDEEVYSGVYGRCSVSFACYNNDGNRGVGVYLNNVQVIEDGERLGGKQNYSAKSDFE